MRHVPQRRGPAHLVIQERDNRADTPLEILPYLIHVRVLHRHAIAHKLGRSRRDLLLLDQLIHENAAVFDGMLDLLLDW